MTIIPPPPFAWPRTLRLFPVPQDKNYGWKGVVLTRLRRSRQNRRRCSHSHLRTSRDAWNDEKIAGIAVYMPKRTTSKQTVEYRS
jgi:hypothetical protein